MSIIIFYIDYYYNNLISTLPNEKEKNLHNLHTIISHPSTDS